MNNMNKLIPLISLGLVVALSSCAGMSGQNSRAASERPILGGNGR